MRYFIYAIIAAVAASVIAGFFIVGSPQEARLRQFDEQRIQDLQVLQSYIVTFWQGKNQLPERLGDLNDELRGITVLTDPETGIPYEYMVRGDLSFTLCAEFALPGIESARAKITPAAIREPLPIRGGGIEQNWEHGAGKTCFERTIDPDFFKEKPR